MDFLTIIGFLGAGSLIFFGIWIEGALSSLANLHGAVIVLGGTFCATMVNSSFKDMVNSFKAGFTLFFKPRFVPPEEMLSLIKRLANKARQKGVFSLDEEIRNVRDDGFLARLVEVSFATNDENLARLTLEMEISKIRSRHVEVGNVFRTAGLLAPMFGLLGTLIGIISVLKNISDAESVGPAMAVAISSAFYGILMANLLCVPSAGKLRSRSLEELLSKEMMLEGLMDIIFSDRIPTVIEMRLLSFLRAGQVRKPEPVPIPKETPKKPADQAT